VAEQHSTVEIQRVEQAVHPRNGGLPIPASSVSAHRRPISAARAAVLRPVRGAELRVTAAGFTLTLENTDESAEADDRHVERLAFGSTYSDRGEGHECCNGRHR
jgi:hypothetical protein